MTGNATTAAADIVCNGMHSRRKIHDPNGEVLLLPVGRSEESVRVAEYNIEWSRRTGSMPGAQGVSIAPWASSRGHQGLPAGAGSPGWPLHEAHVDTNWSAGLRGNTDVDCVAERVRDVRDRPQREVLVPREDLGHESLRLAQPPCQLHLGDPLSLEQLTQRSGRFEDQFLLAQQAPVPNRRRLERLACRPSLVRHRILGTRSAPIPPRPASHRAARRCLGRPPQWRGGLLCYFRSL